MESQGKFIGNYNFKFSDKIGGGQYGEVYKGQDNKTSETVAIKVLPKKLLENQYVAKLLTNEITILKSLKSPNIVSFIDMYHTQNSIYIITEFCNQGDLFDYFTKKGILPEDEVKSYLKQIVEGYKELYKNNVIHRDMKPQNILIHNSNLKLADFGFARTLEEKDSVMLSFVGSPLYMSPQILKKTQYTNKCDVWSLGVLIFILLFANAPWPAKDYAGLIKAIDEQKLQFPFEPKISIPMKDFLTKCLQKEEKDRLSWEDVFSHPILQ